MIKYLFIIFIIFLILFLMFYKNNKEEFTPNIRRIYHSNFRKIKKNIQNILIKYPIRWNLFPF
jgi:hypothetical protein